MFKSKGFSMIGLMAVVAIIGILAVVSMPVYNQYIERTKVSKEIPVIGTYKQDIAACFMRKDSLDDCNDGESGIHPGLDNNGKIMSLDVFEGNIVVIVDAQNHVTNTSPVELMYIVDPSLTPTSAALNWNLYCNDYNESNNALVKECKGLITDKDGDGYDDSIEEEWNSDPLDPDSVPVNWEPLAPTFTDWSSDSEKSFTSDWEPEITNQTSSFTQTRSYEQTQTREKTVREQDSFSGDIRVVEVVTETETNTGQETRSVAVNNSSNGWTNTGGVYNCSDWTPPASDYYETQTVEQTRTCSQDQENVYTYVVNGNIIETRTETQTNPMFQQNTLSGTMPLFQGIAPSTSDWSDSGAKTYISNWTPDVTGQTSGFIQTRSYTQEQERTISEREQNQLTGDVRVISTTTETQTASGQESRNIDVESTAWQNVGPVFACSSWTPEANTVAEGDSFTQTRSCTQEQEKTYTYSSDNGSIGSMTINRDAQVEQNRQATGTKQVWEPISSTTSDWVNTGSVSYSDWTPTFESQAETTGSFTQTRDSSQMQERTISQREENAFTGEIRVVSTTTEQQVINDTQSRNVFGATTGWENGSIISCSSWTPELNGQNSDFTQTRVCDVNQILLYSYNTDDGESGSLNLDRVGTVTQSQLVEVTGSLGGNNDGWSDWSTYSTSCGNWTPSASTIAQGQNFTQNRSCSDSQERFKYFTVDGQVVNSERETQIVNRTETRQETGSQSVSQCRFDIDNLNSGLTNQSYVANYAGQSGVSYVWNGQLKNNNQFYPPLATSENNAWDPNDGYLYWAIPDGSQNIFLSFYEICRKPKQ